MHRRKRTETEYILLALCAILGLVIIPFTVIRFVSGEFGLALLDAGILIGTMGVFTFVFVTGNVKIPGYVTAAVFILGTISTIYIKGAQQIHWAYPAFVVVFYFLLPKVALLLSCLSIVAIVPVLRDELSTLGILKILVTLFVNVTCAYVFSTVMRNQSRALKKLSQKDPLTQVGNRGAMDASLEKVFEIHVNDGAPMCALMVDIDYFKDINDTFGHQVGDDILIKVAEILELNVRTSESVYRYGGEEFFVLAKDMTITRAEQLGEQLRTKIESSVFKDEARITISVGISALTEEKGTSEWVEQADKALYSAKSKGRNCVVVFEAGQC
ncbi:MAG: GGDEF domain-containing protein [Agarilytica sp.]